MVRILALLFSLLVPLYVFAQQQELSAQQWLQRMVTEGRKVNYQSVISYQYGDHMVSAKLYQSYGQGGEERRLIYLDGKQTEVIDKGDSLMYVDSAVSDASLKAKPLRSIDTSIKNLPDRLAKLGDAYTVSKTGSYRIAGRKAVLINMQPKDPFRYAHKMYIDEETGLLLKSETMADGKTLLERFQVMQLTLDKPKKSNSLQASLMNAKNTLLKKVQFVQSDKQEDLDWQVSWVPKGYSLVSMKKEKKHYSSCMFTDGISSFSVYLEPKAHDYHGGIMQEGASVVISKQINLNGQQKIVTIAGEIPITTAERIIQSIRVSP